MSKTDIIMLAWFSPVVIGVVAIPPALVLLLLQCFCQKVVPALWRHYPRWWRDLPVIGRGTERLNSESL